MNLGEVDTSSRGLSKRSSNPERKTIKVINLNPLNYYPRQMTMLAKKASEEIDTINLTTVELTLQSGDTTLETSLEVTGLVNQSVIWESSDPIPPRTWKITIKTFDEEGLVVHEGNGVLRSSSEGVEVEINLVITIRLITETIGDQKT